MNQKIITDFVNFCQGKAFRYCDPTQKDLMHRKGKSALRQIAKGLGLATEDRDIRSNKGGIAVSGEITLHSDNLYFQIQPDSFMNDNHIMIRSCNGRKDFSGGHNYFLSIEDLRNAQEILNFINDFILSE